MSTLALSPTWVPSMTTPAACSAARICSMITRIMTCSADALTAPFGRSTHEGLPLVSDGSCWVKMAEAAPLITDTDMFATGTVSGGVGDVERSSADPCVSTACSPWDKMPWSVPKSATGPGKRPSSAC